MFNVQSNGEITLEIILLKQEYCEILDQPNEGFLYAGSPWRDKISLAILELQEKGVIQILYDKWWKNTGDVCNRDDKNKESKANALGVENIGKFAELYQLFD